MQARSSRDKKKPGYVFLALRAKGNHIRLCRLPAMADNPNPFAELDLERAIALRWVLRDIKAKRFMLLPVSAVDLAALTDLRLVEIRDGMPVLTEAGHDALD
jgi:hypothetical protein